MEVYLPQNEVFKLFELTDLTLQYATITAKFEMIPKVITTDM